MPPTFIPFDGWSPSPGYFGEGWASARNLYPAFNAWRPWRKFLPNKGFGAGTSSGPIIGCHVHVAASGAGTGAFTPDAQTLYAGSSRRLMTVDPASGIFVDISRGALYGPDFGGWRFATVGNDIWATNWVDQLQRRTNNTGLFANGLTGAFAPRPRFIAVVRQHLVWANDSTGRTDDWGWSDADDATNMNPAAGTTSTSIAGRPAPLISVPGQITGLVGGQYGLAFKARATYLLEYAGPPQVLRAEELSTSIGTRNPSSIIKSRYGVFFLGPDGFYVIEGIAAPRKISPPGIDQVLLDSAFTTTNYGFFTWFDDIQMVGFQSEAFPLVGWIYRNNWGEHGNNIGLIYCPPLDAWTLVDVADANPESGLAPRPTTLFTRPFAPTNYDTLAAFTWDGLEANYAPLSFSGQTSNIFSPSLSLNFRPLNQDGASKFQQAKVDRVLPLFSKEAVGGDLLTPTVTVEPMLDPFLGLGPAGAEAMAAANRNSVDGSFPFQRAGIWARISIQCAAQDFANFHGVLINTELLS